MDCSPPGDNAVVKGLADYDIMHRLRNIGRPLDEHRTVARSAVDHRLTGFRSSLQHRGHTRDQDQRNRRMVYQLQSAGFDDSMHVRNRVFRQTVPQRNINHDVQHTADGFLGTRMGRYDNRITRLDGNQDLVYGR